MSLEYKVQKQTIHDKWTVGIGIIVTVAMLLIGWHHGARRVGAVSWPEQAVLILLHPLQSSAARISHDVVERWRSVRRISELEAENRRLRRQLAELSARNRRLEQYYMENTKLREMLRLGPHVPDEAITAEVIGSSLSNWYQRIRINRGRSDGVRSADVVTTEVGLVGQVVAVAPRASVVTLLTDRESGVGAMILRSRAQGVCQGTGEKLLRLSYLSQDADVRLDDTVVTSGEGGVYPRGRIIGRVVRILRDRHGSTQTALVEPSADLTRLEIVFVLRKRAGESR